MLELIVLFLGAPTVISDAQSIISRISSMYRSPKQRSPSFSWMRASIASAKRPPFRPIGVVWFGSGVVPRRVIVFGWKIPYEEKSCAIFRLAAKSSLLSIKKKPIWLLVCCWEAWLRPHFFMPLRKNASAWYFQ